MSKLELRLDLLRVRSRPGEIGDEDSVEEGLLDFKDEAKVSR